MMSHDTRMIVPDQSESRQNDLFLVACMKRITHVVINVDYKILCLQEVMFFLTIEAQVFLRKT